ncbi:TPA: phosphate ABC transporter permease subunit PstC [bacterium]|nr:phosphate ABC transporter permease subunit PstC [bacterium]
MKERLIKGGLSIIALTSLGSLFLIAFFIFKEGIPIILRVGPDKFFFSTNWRPFEKEFGILSMIVGSLSVTCGTLILSVPLGVGCAIFLAFFAPTLMRQLLKPVLELLFAIPSVVYGFMGVVILIPLIQTYFGGPGYSILACSIVLTIMILPVIVSLSLDAIQAVPRSYLEGALALGATKWQAIWRVILPAARSGINAGVILAMAGTIGETMAVIMVAGNSVKMPHSILDAVRPLTANIALEMGYATGEHQEALFATGVVLFIVIMILNVIARFVAKSGVSK